MTRGAVVSERVPGGFAAVYKVLSRLEETGRCRRGYFVEGLGAAQFGTSGAVDRLRTYAELAPDAEPVAVALAATDPANPYGAALPWPERDDVGEASSSAPGSSSGSSPGGAGAAGTRHRPGRKAGALVVLVDGRLTLYVERGGRTLLTWTDDAARLTAAARALAEAAQEGALGRLTVEKADGAAILGAHDTPLRAALDAAGFVATPQGLRLRSRS